MLDYIKEALTFNWGVVIIGIALTVLIFKGVCELWDWFFRRFEIETKSMKERRETKEQLKATADLAKTTAENLDKLETQHTKDEKEFRENLNRHMTESEKDRKALHQEMKQYSENRIKDREQSMKIQKELTSSMDRLAVMFLDKEIEDMRWEILNFCSALSNGRKYNREAYAHVFSTYERYEKILEENGKENGLVEESMAFIRNQYQKDLENGTVK